MEQRPARPVQLPDHKAVIRVDKGKRLGEIGTITITSRGAVIEQMTLFEAQKQDCRKCDDITTVLLASYRTRKMRLLP